jgi:FkbM family methyltransferase
MTASRLYKHVHARHGRLAFFANDTGAVAQSLLKYGEWAENEIAFVSSFIGEGSTVLDIGAYVGTHTLAFAERVGLSGVVLAFEPQPAAFRVLEANIAANGLSRVQCHNTAIADAPGEVVFPAIDPARDASFGSASLQSFLESSGQAEPVSTQVARIPVVTVDQFELDRCDLMKIDVEGCEALVLKGAEATITRHKPAIYAECNSVDAGLRTWKAMQGLGYDVRLHVVDAYNPDNYRADTENIFGDGREVALVGVPREKSAFLDARVNSPREMLLRVETADDLVVGLLNKPQYFGEVLAVSAAARTGGSNWLSASFRRLETLAEERLQEIVRISAQLNRTHAALESTRARVGEIEREAEAARVKSELLQEELHLTRDIHRGKINKLAAELRDSQAESARMVAKLNALYKSTSWRVAAPVRLLGRMLRRA